MFQSQPVLDLVARFSVVLALVPCASQAATLLNVQSVRMAQMARPAASRPKDPRQLAEPGFALAAIRTEWMQCGERAFGPPELQQCDDRAIHAADALLPRSGASHRLEELEADLFEPIMQIRAVGGYRSATQVVVIHSFAKLARRRAAILTGVSQRPTAHEQVNYSLRSLLLRAANQRDRLVRQLMGPTPAQSWLRRWLAIRNEDCAAYPVPRCAALLDGAFRAMLYDNLSNGGERRVLPLRR